MTEKDKFYKTIRYLILGTLLLFLFIVMLMTITF